MPQGSATEGPSWIGARYVPLVLLVAAFAVLLHLPVLGLHMQADDFAQSAMIDGSYSGEPRSLLDLYKFVADSDVERQSHWEQGVLPWFASSRIHMAVWRPLSSLSLAFDRWLMPSWEGGVFWWHLHSLVWLFFTIVAGGLALRRFLPASVALLALVLVACDASFFTPVAWVANRCALISATFGWLAVWAHLGWREAQTQNPSRVRRYFGLEMVTLALALAGGEYGLCAAGYVLAYELVGRPGESKLGRLRALAPAAGLCAIYLASRLWARTGAAGLVGYLSVWDTPSLWKHVAGETFPRLIAAGLWTLPASPQALESRFGDWAQSRGIQLWSTTEPSAQQMLDEHFHYALFAIAVAIAIAASAWKHMHSKERRPLAILALGSIFAILPTTAAPPNMRVLMVASLGMSALVAALIVAGYRALRDANDRPWRRVLLPSAAALLLFIHTVAEVQLIREVGRRWLERDAKLAQLFDAGDLLEQDLADKDVVLLNISDYSSGFYGAYVLGARGLPLPRTWRSLTISPIALYVQRPAENTLEMAAISHHWFRGLAHFYHPPEEKMPAGTVIERPGLRIEVLDDRDGAPTKVRFVFPHSLDDPRYRFFVVEHTALFAWTPIAVGGSYVVPLPRLLSPDDPKVGALADGRDR